MPGWIPETWTGLLPETDPDFSPSFLLPGSDCVSAVHQSDHLQETQVLLVPRSHTFMDVIFFVTNLP